MLADVAANVPYALSNNSYTLELLSPLTRFNISKLVRLPKNSIRLNITYPCSAVSLLEYTDRSLSACLESVWIATSISWLGMFSYHKDQLVTVLDEWKAHKQYKRYYMKMPIRPANFLVPDKMHGYDPTPEDT
jgi:hypothetical protein